MEQLYKPNMVVRTFGIIPNAQNEILMCLRHDGDIRNLPGGRVDKGEGPREGVIREIEEETRLKSEISKLLAIYKTKYQEQLLFFFECKATGGKIGKTVESRECKYFNLNELPHNIPQKDKIAISDRKNRDGNVITKTI